MRTRKLLALLSMLVLVASVAHATTVNLGFTAVADDGNIATSGPAATYVLRYSELPITESNFDAATQLETGAPKAPGEAENYTFELPNGDKHFYFAIKVYDRAFNGSAMSNLAEADFFRPATVGNLRVLKP